MKSKPIAIFLFTAVCLIITTLGFWNFREENQALIDFNSTPLSEFEAEEYTPDLSDKVIISGIEGNAEFNFPSSSRDIYSYTTGLRDIFIQVRFTIDSTDLQDLIDSTRCDQPLQTLEMPPDDSSARFNWWKLSEAKKVQKCSGSTENFGQIVYVDMTNPDAYIVYVEGGTR